MKKATLFCTKAWFYLVELPLAVLYIILLRYNGRSEASLKLYPLIAVVALLMIFILIFFYRTLTVSYSEIRYHGPFAPRDGAMLSKDKTVIITMRPKGRLGVCIYGNDGIAPMYGGLKDEESIDIYLFRGKAVGGKGAVRRVLRYFELPEDDIKACLTEESFSKEYELVSVTAEHLEDIREVKIKLKETV